ncbi:MAG: hypothetical protein ACRDE2_12895, partial [Chitinophagaceae bacterium]
MRRLLIFALLFSCSINLQTQEITQSDKVKTELSSVADNLKDNDFFIVGQLHDNMANTLIEKDILFSLDKRFGVRYDILEYAESAAFLLNQYLNTGNDSLLLIINPKAGFNFIASVKKFNDTTHLRKIKFYGLDFEDRNNGRDTKKALEIILKDTGIRVNHPLNGFLERIINCPSNQMEKSITKLKNYINSNQSKCRGLLSKYYIPVLLIANAKYHFVLKRSKFMFDNFQLLYNELSREKSPLKFLCSFGMGHIMPNNKNSFSMRLLISSYSPVKGSVAIIGIQYYNCSFYT